MPDVLIWTSLLGPVWLFAEHSRDVMNQGEPQQAPQNKLRSWQHVVAATSVTNLSNLLCILIMGACQISVFLVFVDFGFSLGPWLWALAVVLVTWTFLYCRSRRLTHTINVSGHTWVPKRVDFHAYPISIINFRYMNASSGDLRVIEYNHSNASVSSSIDFRARAECVEFKQY